MIILKLGELVLFFRNLSSSYAFLHLRRVAASMMSSLTRSTRKSQYPYGFFIPFVLPFRQIELRTIAAKERTFKLNDPKTRVRFTSLVIAAGGLIIVITDKRTVLSCTTSIESSVSIGTRRFGNRAFFF